jgi:hypothetical protein
MTEGSLSLNAKSVLRIGEPAVVQRNRSSRFWSGFSSPQWHETRLKPAKMSANPKKT